MSERPESKAEGAAEGAKAKQARLSQSDVPGYSLDQALRVVQAIADNYAYNPTRPMLVASALKMTPSSGGFRGMTGAAVAYGLTTGASNAPEIGLTPLGLRIVRPTSEGDDLAARREALLRPRVVGEFLRDYDNAALPPAAIAKNVLLEKGVPAERLDAVLQLIIDSAAAVGFIHDLKGRQYVDLSASTSAHQDSAEEGAARPLAATSLAGPSLTPSPTPTAQVAPAVSLGAGIHVNIEIHIAADATTETIEDIFKNMRRYVLNPEPEALEG